MHYSTADNLCAACQYLESALRLVRLRCRWQTTAHLVLAALAQSFACWHLLLSWAPPWLGQLQVGLTESTTRSLGNLIATIEARITVNGQRRFAHWLHCYTHCRFVVVRLLRVVIVCPLVRARRSSRTPRTLSVVPKPCRAFEHGRSQIPSPARSQRHKLPHSSATCAAICKA